MSDTKKCTRCGAAVPSILNGPPPADVVPFTDRDSWRRFGILMERRTTTTVQLRETYTTLDLCDSCAGAVFLFAQGKPEAGR